ncbi:MAG TPA: CPBP family intramembrane glutamic endopeptidase [Anaerolineae bacterium]|nr:CPBP family intramembrane glutamic endopeptidase [Anaerolineae bacterium]
MISTIDRKRIYIFVAIAYGSSIAVALVLFNDGISLSDPMVTKPLAANLLRVLMFAPAVANIATRLITREGWSNMLLRPTLRRGWPLYLAALFLPALATLVGGATYYLLFPSRFDPSMTYAREELGITPVGGATDPWTFIIIQTASTIPMFLIYIPLMFGEEFGWRAYLLPKLVPLGPRKAVLLVGAIHAVWHWPIIFLGYEYGFDYWGAPVVGPLLFVWICFLLSTFLGWLTLRSGSVWPAAIAHGVMNASPLLMVWFIRGPIDLLIGPVPVGIIGSLGLVLLALPIFFIPGALAPTAGPQPERSASASSTLEGSRV